MLTKEYPDYIPADALPFLAKIPQKKWPSTLSVKQNSRGKIEIKRGPEFTTSLEKTHLLSHTYSRITLNGRYVYARTDRIELLQDNTVLRDEAMKAQSLLTEFPESTKLRDSSVMIVGGILIICIAGAATYHFFDQPGNEWLKLVVAGGAFWILWDRVNKMKNKAVARIKGNSDQPTSEN